MNPNLTKMFKALSNPNRLKLFCEIAQASADNAFNSKENSCLVNTIMGKLNIGAPTISHHLKELVQAELITTERRGKFLTCAVNIKSIETLREFFGDIFKHNDTSTSSTT